MPRFHIRESRRADIFGRASAEHTVDHRHDLGAGDGLFGKKRSVLIADAHAEISQLTDRAVERIRNENVREIADTEFFAVVKRRKNLNAKLGKFAAGDRRVRRNILAVGAFELFKKSETFKERDRTVKPIVRRNIGVITRCDVRERRNILAQKARQKRNRFGAGQIVRGTERSVGISRHKDRLAVGLCRLRGGYGDRRFALVEREDSADMRNFRAVGKHLFGNKAVFVSNAEALEIDSFKNGRHRRVDRADKIIAFGLVKRNRTRRVDHDNISRDSIL